MSCDSAAAAAGNPITLHHDTHLAGLGLGSYEEGKCQFRFTVALHECEEIFHMGVKLIECRDVS